MKFQKNLKKLEELLTLLNTVLYNILNKKMEQGKVKFLKTYKFRFQ
jgi:hypothetical protein